MTEPTTVPATTPPKPKTNGARNLFLLGIGASLIALATTFVSLKIYHDSGDIYLDRSRPGFLPEAEENAEKPEDTNFTFSDSGELTQENLDEYLKNLKKELDRLNDFTSEPFNPTPLSDETLGL